MIRTSKVLLHSAALFFIFAVPGIMAKSSVSMPYQKVIIEKENGKAVFKNVSLYGEPGQPNLPNYTVTFLLPAQADLGKISVVLENVKEQELDGVYDVDAALPPTTSGQIVWPSNKNIVNGKDIDVYNRNDFFPAKNIGSIEAGKMRQYKLVTVSFFPVRYNPVTKKLRMIVGGQLSIYDSPEAGAKQSINSNSNSSKALSKRLQSLVVNYDQNAASYGLRNGTNAASFAITSETGTYAIVTTRAIASQSTQLQNFIDSKSARGFTVQLIDETVWGGGKGDAAAENLRSWLQANYLTRDISYLLLIGNPDTDTGDVPMKMAWPRTHVTRYLSDQNCPTDFYYAELTGDWDADEDDTVGEWDDDYGVIGGVDKFAELSVGRIPFYGNISDLDHILAKTIAYENESSATAAWRTKVLLPMKPSDEYTPGYQLGEEINNEILKTVGWKNYRIYEKNYGVNPDNSPCTYSSVYQGWMSGTYGEVIWWTHGGSDGASSIMSTQYTPFLNDKYPSITFQVSCHNAYPETDQNLCYSLLKNGAIATIGATRVSWYYRGESTFSTSNSNATMSRVFAHNSIVNGMTVSDALTAVKATLSPSYDLWMNWLVFVVYGDPSISVYSSAGNIITIKQIADQKILLGGNFESIDLNNSVFNSKFTSNQVTWSISGNVNLNVVTGADGVVTVTPKSSSWIGKESIIFKATAPDGTSSSDTAIFEIGVPVPQKTIDISIIPLQGNGCSQPEWEPSRVYLQYDQCSHNGHIWQARWWTQNQEPGTTGQYGPWEDLGECTLQYDSYHGKVIPSGIVSVDSGSSITINAIPDLEYTTSELIVDGQQITPMPNDSYTFHNVTTNHTVQVKFQKEEYYYLNTEVSGLSDADYYRYYFCAVGSGAYATKTPVPITAIEIPGYTFKGWRITSGVGTIANPGNRFTEVECRSSNVTVTADYEIADPYDCILTSTPTTIDFGAVLINSSQSETITLANTGNSNAVVTSINSSSALVTSTETLPLTIPAGTSKNITVTFNPVAAGTVSGTLTITNAPGNVPVQTIEVPFNGQGVTEFNWNLRVTSPFATNATISFSANPQYAGETATFRLYEIFRNGQPRVLTETFSREISSGQNTFTRPVWDYLPGHYYILEMSDSADVLLDDFPFEKLYKAIEFSLNAVPAQVTTDVTVSFNNPSPYLVDDTAVLLFRNGTSYNTVTTSIDSGVNTVTQSMGSAYYPLGNYEVILSINQEAVDTAFFTKVEKTHHLSASVSSINMGSVNVGNSKTATVTLINTGNSAALISSISTSDAVFSVVHATPDTVIPGDSVVLTVAFTPTAAGTKEGTLTINNAPDEQIQIITIALSGTGVVQAEKFDVTMIPDENSIGNSIQPIITIKNIGTSNVDLTNIVIEYYLYEISVNVNNLTTDTYYCNIQDCRITGTYSKLAQVYGSATQKADTKAALTLNTGVLVPNASVQLNFSIHSIDWQYNFNESDDWSHTVQDGKAPFIVIRDKTTDAVLYGTVPTGM